MSRHTSLMRVPQRLWILSASALAMLAIVTAYISRNREPRYNGYTLEQLLYNATHQWVMHPRTPGGIDGGLYPDPAAQAAVCQAGTNALPQLIGMITYEPHPLRVKLLELAQQARQTRVGRLVPASFATDGRAANAELAVRGFGILGPTASPAIPQLERLGATSHSPDVAGRAIDGLIGIGQAALPALMRLSTNPPTRLHAFSGILQIGYSGVPITTEIQEIISTGDMVGAEMALHAINRLPATNALPILTNLLSHPASRLRKAAAENLPWFFRDARCAIPALRETVNDTNADVRAAALDALRRLAPEMFVTNGSAGVGSSR